MNFVSEVITDDKKSLCAVLLQTLVNESDAIDTAVLASPDGLMLAGTGIDDELDVMAAMSASLISLADALSSRSEDGHCDKVLSESNDGTLVVLHAGGLILTVLGKAQANMGLVLSASRDAAKKITQAIEKS
ncbi:MAG: roadblock/LC7 domain-containing protein [Mariprofundaceae bacterium]|nr:roadblock/LC7 domain-containing protein [Mariprofundaceae bacterium]